LKTRGCEESRKSLKRWEKKQVGGKSGRADRASKNIIWGNSKLGKDRERKEE